MEFEIICAGSGCNFVHQILFPYCSLYVVLVMFVFMKYQIVELYFSTFCIFTTYKTKCIKCIENIQGVHRDEYTVNRDQFLGGANLSGIQEKQIAAERR